MIPLVKRALPAARLPFQDPGVLAVAAGASLGGTLLRRRAARRGRRGRRRRSSASCRRCSRCAAASWPPTTASSTRRSAPTRPTTRTRPTRRRSTTAAARISSRRCSRRTSRARCCCGASSSGRARSAAAAVALASSAVAVEVFAWCERHAETPRGARAQAPGFEIQRLIGTREPDERQLEVGRAALAEILRAEGRREATLDADMGLDPSRAARPAGILGGMPSMEAIAVRVVPGRELDHHVGADHLHGPAGVLHLADAEADAADEAAADQAGVVAPRSAGTRSPAPTRPRRSCARSSSSCATPSASTRSARTCRRASCCTARPAPARRCSPRPSPRVRRAVLLPVGGLVRRDVRRPRRRAHPAPLRRGAQGAAGDHLHRRARRRRRRSAAPTTTPSASRRSTSCWSRWTASARPATSS